MRKTKSKKQRVPTYEQVVGYLQTLTPEKRDLTVAYIDDLLAKIECETDRAQEWCSMYHDALTEVAGYHGGR